MKVALHTTLRADRIEEYEAAHREVPVELTDAIRAAGVTSWTIWRSGTDLFHMLECDNTNNTNNTNNTDNADNTDGTDGYARLLAELEHLPVNVAWQARMGELTEQGHDYSPAGAAAGLPVVWELP